MMLKATSLLCAMAVVAMLSADSAEARGRNRCYTGRHARSYQHVSYGGCYGQQHYQPVSYSNCGCNGYTGQVGYYGGCNTGYCASCAPAAGAHVVPNGPPADAPVPPAAGGVPVAPAPPAGAPPVAPPPPGVAPGA